MKTNPKQCFTKNKVFGFAHSGGGEGNRTPVRNATRRVSTWLGVLTEPLRLGGCLSLAGRGAIGFFAAFSSGLAPTPFVPGSRTTYGNHGGGRSTPVRRRMEVLGLPGRAEWNQQARYAGLHVKHGFPAVP